MTQIKQFSLVLCCVLSLFVSSVSACYCAHSQVVQQNEQHCAPQPASHHEQKADNQSADHHSSKTTGKSHHNSASEIELTLIDVSDECCCVQPSPKVYAKSESIKIQKQSATLVAFAVVELKLVAQPQTIKAIGFNTPFYLSDSLYNLSPGRAPPVL